MTEPRRSLARRWWPFAVALLVGFGLGYVMSFAASEGGLGAIFRGGLALFAVVAIALVVGVPGVILLTTRPGNPTGPVLVGTVGALVGGVVLAHLIVPTFGLGYRAPVELQASGAATLTIDEPGFVATEPASIDCRSVRDGDAVAWFEALDLGHVDGAVVRASVYLEDGEQLELFVPDSDPPGSNGAPHWQGPATHQLGADGRSGTFDFADLQLQRTEGLPEPAPGWREHLAGRLTWACGPWAGPVGFAGMGSLR